LTIKTTPGLITGIEKYFSPELLSLLTLLRNLNSLKYEPETSTN